MRTSRRPWAGAALALLAIAGVVLAACGTSSTSAGRSPAVSASPFASSSPAASASPSATSTPTPALVGSYGVLVTPPSAANYTVSIVGIDGKVVASAQASSPATVSCGGTAAAVLPLPVSTSNSLVYFMDASGAVRTLSPNGTVSSGPIINLPVASGRRSMFAVSPDDSLMAVVVADFTTGGASTALYVDQLQLGGTQNRIFTETGSFILWPTGWHGINNLVVAKVPACTQGGGPLCCGPQELHVVDPANANRRFTLGSPQCVVAGFASPAGVVCETSLFSQAEVVSWTAITQRSIAIQGPTPAYLSPDGTLVALTDFGTGTTTVDGAKKTMSLQACGWIDATHLLAGGDTQQQPRVGDVSTGTIVPVAAQGDCGGRLPGGL
jgi:hypothetical protein